MPKPSSVTTSIQPIMGPGWASMSKKTPVTAPESIPWNSPRNILQT